MRLSTRLSLTGTGGADECQKEISKLVDEIAKEDT
jgi:hypothetical protein